MANLTMPVLIHPNSTQFDPIRPNSTNSRPPEHGSTPGRAPTLPPSAPDGSMDSLSPGRIYGTTSLDTGTNWRRLVPPPPFPTLWLAGGSFLRSVRRKLSPYERLLA